MLKIGIVGLPNVGKSSLFNLITSSPVEIANYPFATIEPNIGIVEYKDSRLNKLSAIYQSKKTIYPLIKFWDIAGLVKGASKGLGMGNQFLSDIHQADAIIHVVRFFEDKDIVHVHDKIDPKEDFEIINLELILADIQTLQKKIKRIESLKKANNTPEIKKESKLLNQILTLLNKGIMLNAKNWTKDEIDYIKPLNLITFKKMLVVINLKEKDFLNLSKNHRYKSFTKELEKNNIKFFSICIAFEQAIKDLNFEEQNIMRNEYKIPESLFQNFLRKSYEMLDLWTFFTAGPKETRGWSFPAGFTAKKCAGIIHTDFSKGFIRCRVLPFNHLMEVGSEYKAKEKGLIRTEGKEYRVQDGDICHFLFNI